MRKLIFIFFALTALTASAKVDFDHYFDGRALRIDYIFAGDSVKQYIYVKEYAALEKWCGRRVNLDYNQLDGSADVTMRTKADGKTIYCHSFTTHFQDWTGTEQATQLRCAYDHVVLMPMPREAVEIEIRLFDFHQKPQTVLKHDFNPKDILVRDLSKAEVPETQYIIQSGSPEQCIDVAILAEGYTKEELPTFYEDAKRWTETVFSFEPYKSNKDKFNVIAVGAVSQQSGVSEPAKNIWKQTACGTFFDFLYMQRLLGAPKLHQINDLLARVPYEHIFILANTDNYGGCGVYNSYGISAAHSKYAQPVVVHEFGHSFGGLGDEYFYDETYTLNYYPDTEPWHENLTTLADFDSKWKDMLPKKTKIPTSTEGLEKDDCTTLGVFEGGGNQSKLVYRPVINCRMRSNNVKDFCPVCKRAVQRMIDYHLVEKPQPVRKSSVKK